MPQNIGSVHCVKRVRIRSYSGPNTGKYRTEQLQIRTRSGLLKLFGYNFWWNCLMLSNEIRLTIGMRISNNLRHLTQLI